MLQVPRVHGTTEKIFRGEVTVTKIAGSISLAANAFFPFFPPGSLKKGLHIYMVNSAW